MRKERTWKSVYVEAGSKTTGFFLGVNGVPRVLLACPVKGVAGRLRVVFIKLSAPPAIAASSFRYKKNIIN